MRLRTFTAADMPAAMKLVRDSLGEDAIIIASERINGKSVSVTAAIEEEDEAELFQLSSNTRSSAPAIKTPPKLTPQLGEKNPETDNLRYEVQNILRFHNLPELFLAKILQKAAGRELDTILTLHQLSGRRAEHDMHLQALEKILGLYYDFRPLQLEKQSRLMLVGPPGIGKTLTIAKLAAQLAIAKLPTLVITTDNKRAGGVEQLQAFTNILNLPLKLAADRSELIKYLEATPSTTHVLIDTAGCNPYDNAELQELKSFTAIENIEPVLVLPAGGDSLEAIDVVEALTALPIQRLLITRADTARRFGGVLAAAAAHGLSFCNASSSSSIVDAPQALDSNLLAKFLLRYQSHMNQS